MLYKEFGTQGAPAVVLLHGGGLNWWSFREAALLLAPRLHVLVPVLDGHAGSSRPFTSIEECAGELLRFIDEKLGGAADLIGGLSLGAQVLLETLSQRPDVCRCALVESASVLPSRLTAAAVGPACACSYGLIRSRRFAKLQFRALHIKDDLFEEYYRDTCAIAKDDLVAFMKASASYSLKPSLRDTAAEVHVYAGGKEGRGMRASADAIGRAVPGSRVTVLPGRRHGEFSICRADAYARAVFAMLGIKDNR